MKTLLTLTVFQNTRIFRIWHLLVETKIYGRLYLNISLNLVDYANFILLCMQMYILFIFTRN